MVTESELTKSEVKLISNTIVGGDGGNPSVGVAASKGCTWNRGTNEHVWAEGGDKLSLASQKSGALSAKLRSQISLLRHGSL